MTSIAIIGSGISGLGAAYALEDAADVTLYERRPRIGGHAWTQTVDYDGTRIDVDVGFIVYNGLNYPNLIGFFDALGVATQDSDMSFAVSDPDGWEWASSARGLFAQPSNLLNPAFHRFWRTILKFNDTARAEFGAGTITDHTLGQWLDRHGYDETFRDNYILPMAAAIWSTPERGVLDYPAESFFRFFDNHRLMHRDRPIWRTVTGGSRQYVDKAVSALSAQIRPACPVVSIKPFGDKIRLVTEAGAADAVHDEVIFACHADQALALLDPAYETQRLLLGSVRYRPNRIFLHRDPALMPRRKAAWASWNVLKQPGGDICLTYWMNRLQGIDRTYPLFVTLNPERPPRDDLTFSTFELDHPQFDAAAEAAVRAIKRHQGDDGLWFAGAWMGSGFHEDGLKSGLACALALGGNVPWDAQGLEPYVRKPREGQSVTAAGAAL
ncbi:MAG: FAD-dependent oxidoreductase [Pseudomonadota bacterium]